MATLSKESGGRGRRVHARALGRRQQETAMAVLEEVEPFLSAEFFKKAGAKCLIKSREIMVFLYFFKDVSSAPGRLCWRCMGRPRRPRH